MKQLSCILIALTFVAVYGYGCDPDKSTTGTPVKMGECPHCVSIRLHGSHFCSGNIILPRLILTIADCVSPVIEDSSLMEYFTVVSGTIDLHSGGEIHEVQKVWTHEEHHSTLSLSNPYVGVIRLRWPIEFGPTRQPITLEVTFPIRIAEDDNVTIAAWGFLNLEERRQDLHKVNARIKLTNTCKKYHPNLPSHSSFCILTNATGLSYCDNGSGLIRDSDQLFVGLVSRGRNLELCAMEYPYTYIAIAPYIPWIVQLIIAEYPGEKSRKSNQYYSYNYQG